MAGLGNERIAFEAKKSSVLGICSFRALVGWEVARGADDKRLTKSQLLEMLELESIKSLIRKRKLQWVAHYARRGDKDLMWKRMAREVEDEKSKWGD